jgi:N-acetylmuramoyl-L-alanine amidase
MGGYVAPVQSNVSRRDVLKCAAAAPVFVGLSGLAASLGAPAARAASGVAGAIVFLDPGHNGANDASINGPRWPTGSAPTRSSAFTPTADLLTAAMITPEGRAKYAGAVVQGINAYLAQRGS